MTQQNTYPQGFHLECLCVCVCSKQRDLIGFIGETCEVPLG